MISRRSIIRSIVGVGLFPFTLFAGQRTSVKRHTVKVWEFKRYKRPNKAGWLGWLEVHGEGIAWIDLEGRIMFCQTQYNKKRHVREAWELKYFKRTDSKGFNKLLKVHGKAIALITPDHRAWFLNPLPLP